MRRDCLICFGPIRRNAPIWVQATHTPCNCRPHLHRACWEAWAAQAGPVCVICRSQKFPPAPPLLLNIQPLHDGPHLFGYPINRTTAVVVMIFVFYITLLALNYFQPAHRPTYRPLYNRHIEL
jgi:hypothetical protein